MPLSPESAVKKLSRLASNCICANCGTRSQYGFSTVCIKYLTFVCNACKSSHQAVSHRCKSLTMSSWDHGEVLQLKTHGNDYARQVWLANAPPIGVGGRPKEGDDINVFKRFVVEAYENKRYYREPSADGGRERAAEAGDAHPPAPHATHSTRRGAAARKKPAPPERPRRPPARAAPAPAPPPAVDLLDFGAFDSAPAPPQRPPQQPAQTAPAMDILQPPTNDAAAPASDPFFDPFNNHPPTTDTAVASGAADPIKESGNGHASGTPLGAPDGVAPSAATPSFDPFGGAIPRTSVGADGRNDDGQQPPKPRRVVMNPPATAMNRPMNDSGGIMSGGMGSNNQSNAMMMNGGMVANGGRNSMTMTGGMVANGGNHFMMMNGGTTANDANNSVMISGGTMHSSNAMAIGGGMMTHNSSMNTGNNGMMMNGGMGMGMGGMMNGNSMMMATGGMMNNNGMMHNMNFSMNSNNFMSAGGNQQHRQQQQPPPAMNMNVMKPMNNSISNNLGARPAAASLGDGSLRGSAAASKPNKKPDPFAGLGF